jgi:hypothetical protein
MGGLAQRRRGGEVRELEEQGETIGGSMVMSPPFSWDALKPVVISESYDRTAGSRRLDTKSEDLRRPARKKAIGQRSPARRDSLDCDQGANTAARNRWQDLTHLSVISSGREEMDSPQLRQQCPLAFALSAGVPHHANRPDSHPSFSSPRT